MLSDNDGLLQFTNELAEVKARFPQSAKQIRDEQEENSLSDYPGVVHELACDIDYEYSGCRQVPLSVEHQLNSPQRAVTESQRALEGLLAKQVRAIFEEAIQTDPDQKRELSRQMRAIRVVVAGQGLDVITDCRTQTINIAPDVLRDMLMRTVSKAIYYVLLKSTDATEIEGEFLKGFYADSTPEDTNDEDDPPSFFENELIAELRDSIQHANPKHMPPLFDFQSWAQAIARQPYIAMPDISRTAFLSVVEQQPRLSEQLKIGKLVEAAKSLHTASMMDVLRHERMRSINGVRRAAQQSNGGDEKANDDVIAGYSAEDFAKLVRIVEKLAPNLNDAKIRESFHSFIEQAVALNSWAGVAPPENSESNSVAFLRLLLTTQMSDTLLSNALSFLLAHETYHAAYQKCDGDPDTEFAADAFAAEMYSRMIPTTAVIMTGFTHQQAKNAQQQISMFDGIDPDIFFDGFFRNSNLYNGNATHAPFGSRMDRVRSRILKSRFIVHEQLSCVEEALGRLDRKSAKACVNVEPIGPEAAVDEARK